MAGEWLSRVLASGPRAVSEIEAEAKAAGLSWSTVRRATNQLGVTSEKTAFTEGWAWRLPEEAMPGEEIEL
jgi:hypothetical protein